MDRSKQEDFIKVFRKLSYRYSAWQIWNDFLYMACAAMTNVMPVPEREEREKQYLSIINRYRKEEQILFPEMLAIVTLALEENPEQDFLGSMYHALELQQEQKGQFFTPYHICDFMSEIQITDEAAMKKELAEKGYISVSDPACGAGAMLIAFANTMQKHEINYQKKVLFVAQDIDHTAAYMCYLQLALLGCPAIIVIGDSLVKPGFHPDNEIWYTPMYYLNSWRFQEPEVQKTVLCAPEPEALGQISLEDYLKSLKPGA